VPPDEPPALLFAALVALVERVCESLAWDLVAVAVRLTEQGIPPALGAAAWDRYVVDRLLVHASSAKQACSRQPA
jgi:hypothetical protein